MARPMASTTTDAFRDHYRRALVDDLIAAGVRPGVPLLVHSSLSAIGRVPGGADTVRAMRLRLAYHIFSALSPAPPPVPRPAPLPASPLPHPSLPPPSPPRLSHSKVIDALLEAVGPKGTLCIPTLSYLFCTELSPTFHVERTPTNLGAIPQVRATPAATLYSTVVGNSV